MAYRAGAFATPKKLQEAADKTLLFHSEMSVYDVSHGSRVDGKTPLAEGHGRERTKPQVFPALAHSVQATCSPTKHQHSRGSAPTRDDEGDFLNVDCIRWREEDRMVEATVCNSSSPNAWSSAICSARSEKLPKGGLQCLPLRTDADVLNDRLCCCSLSPWSDHVHMRRGARLRDHHLSIVASTTSSDAHSALLRRLILLSIAHDLPSTNQTTLSLPSARLPLRRSIHFLPFWPIIHVPRHKGW